MELESRCYTHTHMSDQAVALCHTCGPICPTVNYCDYTFKTCPRVSHSHRCCSPLTCKQVEYKQHSPSCLVTSLLPFLHPSTSLFTRSPCHCTVPPPPFCFPSSVLLLRNRELMVKNKDTVRWSTEGEHTDWRGRGRVAVRHNFNCEHHILRLSLYVYTNRYKDETRNC